jgi:hypothetical protein
VPSFPIAYLRDNFEDNIEASVWSQSFTTGSATKTESAGRATFTLPSSTAGSHNAVYATDFAYDLTGDGIYININQMVATGVAATAFFEIIFDASNYIEWTQTSNTIKARKIVAGVTTDLYSATWSSTTYKYLRIRESGGDIEFHSSTNGTSWTLRATITGLPFAITELRVAIGASCGNVASPGAFKVEDINLILPALTTTWHWTEIEWPLWNRYRDVTLAATSGQACVVTASSIDASGNLVDAQYWSGPLWPDGGVLTLTSQPSLSAAQAMAVNLPTNDRWTLPNMADCRIIRLYHRSITGSSYTLREFYARRLVQADDVEAELFRGLRFEGHQFLCDQLSALAADMGTLTAGTIIGATIKTAVSGARIEMSGAAFGGLIGYAGSDTYDPLTGLGTYQILWDKADGRFYWANKTGFADANGLNIIPDTTYVATRAYRFVESDKTTVVGLLQALYGTAHFVQLMTAPGSGGQSTVDIYAEGNGAASTVNIHAESPLTPNAVAVTLSNTNVASTSNIHLNAGSSGYVKITGGLNLGSATGAGNGQLSTSGSAALGDAINSVTRLRVKGASSTSSDYALVLVNSANSLLLAVRNDNRIGFFGATEVARQTVTGSRGGNAALASLLTGLANLGLITDSST